MIEHPHSEYNKQVYYRLIALWVSCEAFAGGIMHGIKLPFSGLIVSSLAIICIVLIAYHVPSPSSIIKATLIVVIFKFILSPHSPPTAYIAVLFQGILGQILFRNHRYFKLAAIILAILGLVESAIQRILVLMIVYGNDLWKAINIFIQKLTREKDPTNYSLVIGIAYIILHAVIGIFVGIFATRLAKNSLAWKDKYPSLMVRHASPDLKGEVLLEQKHDPRKIKIIFILIWLALVLFYIQGKLYPANTIIPSNIIIDILVRSIFIILTWYILLSPIIMILIRKLIYKHQSRYHDEMKEVLKLIPETKHIFTHSLELSSAEKGFSRLKSFLKILLINILSE